MRDQSTSELRLHLCQCLSEEVQNRGGVVKTVHLAVINERVESVCLKLNISTILLTMKMVVNGDYDDDDDDDGNDGDDLVMVMKVRYCT